MQKFLLLLTIGFLISQSGLFAQGDEQYRDIYQNKIEKFTKMRNAGIIITAGGAAMTIAGIATMVNNVDTDDDYYSDDDENAGAILLGMLGIELGCVAIAGGTTLWIIGGAKKASYEHKLRSLSLNVSPNTHKALSLVYKF